MGLGWVVGLRWAAVVKRLRELVEELEGGVTHMSRELEQVSKY
jgi:hypothetical protein